MKNNNENDDEEGRAMLDTGLYSNDNQDIQSDAFYGSNFGSPVRRCTESAAKAVLTKQIVKPFKKTLSFIKYKKNAIRKISRKNS